MEVVSQLSARESELCASPWYRNPGTQGSKVAGHISSSTECALSSCCHALLPFEDLTVILLCTPQRELNSD